MPQTQRNPSVAVRGSAGEVAVVFLKLGLLAYGGMAGLVAMMRREMVERRRWVGDQEFLDLLGICNLMPGPTAVEMSIALGYERAGWPALILGGVCFILPAVLMVLALAWAYVRYGMLPAAQWIFYGAYPVVIAIIADALWSLGRAAVKSTWLAALVVATIALYFWGVPIVAILFGAALLAGAVAVATNRRKAITAIALPLLGAAAGASAAAPFSMLRLFLTFMKIGAVSYGSGYALVAFLRADFVDRLHWLTNQQLLDSVAIALITPGPVFAAATFIGYLKGGVAGALISTLGIFLPSFAFIAIVFPLIPKLKKSALARVVLNGLNAATVGLMAAVSWQLARGAILDVFTAVEAVAAFAILLRFKLNSVWLILGGMALGVAAKLAMR
jgi:chromate transporter